MTREKSVDEVVITDIEPSAIVEMEVMAKK